MWWFENLIEKVEFKFELVIEREIIMKYKLIFDSTCGHSETDVVNAGAGFVPITIEINEKTYLTGIDIDNKWLVDNLKASDVTKTAAVTLGLIEESYRKALKEADHVVYFSISKGLSSSYNNAVMVSNEDEFKGKVTVIESEFTTPILQPITMDLIKKSKKLKLDEFIKLVEFYNKDQIIFAMPGTMKRLYKSGRITKAQYIIGSLLKIQPIITYAEGDMTTRETKKSRGLKKATAQMFEMFKSEIKKPQYKGITIMPGIVAQGPEAEWFHNEATKALVEMGIPRDMHYNTELDAAAMAHVGTELYCIAINKKAH